MDGKVQEQLWSSLYKEVLNKHYLESQEIYIQELNEKHALFDTYRTAYEKLLTVDERAAMIEDYTKGILCIVNTYEIRRKLLKDHQVRDCSLNCVKPEGE
jgi:hypothetical protein